MMTVITTWSSWSGNNRLGDFQLTRQHHLKNKDEVKLEGSVPGCCTRNSSHTLRWGGGGGEISEMFHISIYVFASVEKKQSKINGIFRLYKEHRKL